jgi:hypothetical protein
MGNLVRRSSESNIERLQKQGVAFAHGYIRCVEDFTGIPPGIELICDASAPPSVVSGYTNPMFDSTNNMLGVIASAGPFGKIDQGWVVWWAVACWFSLPSKYIGWGGKQVRDILFVEDVCRLVDLEIRQIGRLRYGVFNAGGGAANSLSLVEAMQFLEKRLGRSMSVSNGERPRKADAVIYYWDNREVARLLGWGPKVSLVEGTDSILAWIGENEAELSAWYRSAS